MRQWTFTTRDYLSNLFTPSVSHTCTLIIWWEIKITTMKLSLRVDIQIEEQRWFNKWWFTKLKLNICCVHLFLLAKITKNELVLSLYSLSSKTSRYALFGHNRLTVYGIRLAACMLSLQPKFKFLNIRYAACEIRLAVEVPETFCPNSVYRLSGSG